MTAGQEPQLCGSQRTNVPGAAGTLKNPVSTGAGADIAAKPMKVFYSSITGTVLREDPTAAVR